MKKIINISILILIIFLGGFLLYNRLGIKVIKTKEVEASDVDLDLYCASDYSVQYNIDIFNEVATSEKTKGTHERSEDEKNKAKECTYKKTTDIKVLENGTYENMLLVTCQGGYFKKIKSEDVVMVTINEEVFKITDDNNQLKKQLKPEDKVVVDSSNKLGVYYYVDNNYEISYGDDGEAIGFGTSCNE